jgi:lipoyl(octanoyl) transferase
MTHSPLTHHRALRVVPLGRDVPYAQGMAVMRESMAELEVGSDPVGELLLLEHGPTITVTRSGGLAHLLATPEALADDGFDLVETDRGGDVTFHGPGQLVGYPVVQLRRGDDGRADLLGYLRALEGALVDACTKLGVAGCHRREGMTGVWVTSSPDAPRETWPLDEGAKKLVAIGVGVRRGVTRHGFALNVDIDLEAYTSRIVPCGLVGRGVTSLERELGASRLPDAHTLHSLVAEEVAASLGLPLDAAALVDDKPHLSGSENPDGAFHHG